MDFFYGNLTYKYLGLCIAGLAVALGLDAVLAVRYPDFEVTGRRAGNRLRAARNSVLLPLVWPLLRFFTAYAALINVPKARARLELWLRQADDPAGLVPSELIGLGLMLGLALAVLMTWQFGWPAALPALLLGVYLPYDNARGTAEQRVVLVGRAVPTMADLIVLSMESGMDFIGSVRLLVSKTRVADGRMPIRDELLMFLHQLNLGRTRRSALQLFAERVPADSVRSFTAAVIQAEEKGMPLRDILRIQADILRHRRVQEAESYIATANLRMLGPVMVVVFALLVVIIAPVLNSMSGALAGGDVKF
jgi:tight adherence protein C